MGDRVGRPEGEKKGSSLSGELTAATPSPTEHSAHSSTAPSLGIGETLDL